LTILTVGQSTDYDYYIAPGSINSEIVIQQAIDACFDGDTVDIAPGVYRLSGHIYPRSNTTIVGEVGTVLKLAPGLPNYLNGRDVTSTEWGNHGATATSGAAKGMFQIGEKVHVTIKDITIDGSCDDYYKYLLSHLGVGLFNLITAWDSDYLTFENIYFTQGANDAIALSSCDYVNMKNCTVNKCGHDGIQAYNGSNYVIQYNTFINRGNSSIHLNKIAGAEVFCNNCSTGAQGGALNAVELQGEQTSTWIHHNRIHDINAPGIGEIFVLNPPSFSTALKIYNNIIYSCPAGISIRTTGANIYNNIIDDCFFGIDCCSLATSIDKCIITNIGKTGTGINMGAATTVTNCCFFGNKLNTTKTIGITNSTMDPGYVDKSARNYILAPTNVLATELLGVTADITPGLIEITW